MALFGRNQDFEDDEGFDEVDRRGDRKLTKKFRDLKPGNRRKRKEPVKPWGSKERIIVLVIFLLTVIASAILALHAGRAGGAGFKRPKFSFPSLNIFKEQTIIIQKK